MANYYSSQWDRGDGLLTAAPGLTLTRPFKLTIAVNTVLYATGEGDPAAAADDVIYLAQVPGGALLTQVMMLCESDGIFSPIEGKLFLPGSLDNDKWQGTTYAFGKSPFTLDSAIDMLKLTTSTTNSLLPYWTVNGAVCI